MTDTFDPVAARHNLGLTQRGAAGAAGVPLQTIQRIEKGQGAHPENAKKIADLYGVKVTDLPAFAGEPRPRAAAPSEADAVGRANGSELSERVR